MSHEGTYTYQFTKITPYWWDSNKTIIYYYDLVLSCTYSGTDQLDNPFVNTEYISGQNYFDPSGIPYDTFTGNLSGYCNDFADEKDWWQKLYNLCYGNAFRNPIDDNFPIAAEDIPVSPHYSGYSN